MKDKNINKKHMLKTTIYNNRYGDNIVFSEINENIIHMSGFNMDYMRYGWTKNENDIDMVDPSGGPYLTVGFNLKPYFEDNKNRFIKSIKIDTDKIIFEINENR
jgi:hypothetical protein